jgi:hypothetical protein
MIAPLSMPDGPASIALTPLRAVSPGIGTVKSGLENDFTLRDALG